MPTVCPKDYFNGGGGDIATAHSPHLLHAHPGGMLGSVVDWQGCQRKRLDGDHMYMDALRGGRAGGTPETV